MGTCRRPVNMEGATTHSRLRAAVSVSKVSCHILQPFICTASTTLLHSIYDGSVRRLPSVENAAARLVNGMTTHKHIRVMFSSYYTGCQLTSIFIEPKLAILVYKSLQSGDQLTTVNFSGSQPSPTAIVRR